MKVPATGASQSHPSLPPSTPMRGQLSLALAPLAAAQRERVEQILRGTGVFREEEIGIALEVLDSFFAHPERDYFALGAFTPGGDLVGYICWGLTPCTRGTFDIYWVAVDREAQAHGVGTMLVTEVERRLARESARLVIVETSSLPAYERTRAFYLRRGYDEVARIPDFYQAGDDRVIYAKRLDTQPLG
jgi:ribosomal protein S18 acetylase RimI-like enzyme